MPTDRGHTAHTDSPIGGAETVTPSVAVVTAGGDLRVVHGLLIAELNRLGKEAGQANGDPGATGAEDRTAGREPATGRRGQGSLRPAAGAACWGPAQRKGPPDGSPGERSVLGTPPTRHASASGSRAAPRRRGPPGSTRRARGGRRQRCPGSQRRLARP